MKTAALHNYAEALYEQAAARDELPRSLAALEAAAEVLAAEPELQRLVAHPGISDVRKGELFRAAMGEHDTPLMQDFFQLLLQQDRGVVGKQIPGWGRADAAGDGHDDGAAGSNW